MIKKVLITGITGFAGPHLARLAVRHNLEVHGIVRGSNGRENDLLDVLSPQELSEIRFHYCDLKHYYGLKKIIDKEKFDGIFHLAAQSHPPTSFDDPVMTWADNVTATVNIVTAISGIPTVLMYCSTSEVYGDACKDHGILVEGMPLAPSNPYGASKAAMDLYVRERIRNGFIRGFITRAFSHTGPRRGKTFSISSDAFQIALMEKGLQKPVLKVGNLETRRVVMDVRDCVFAYFRLMMTESAWGDVYNVCGPENEVHSMEFFTDKLIELSTLDKIEKKVHKPFWRPIDIDVQIGSTDKLWDAVLWTPQIGINETLADLLDYWRSKIK